MPTVEADRSNYLTPIVILEKQIISPRSIPETWNILDKYF